MLETATAKTSATMLHLQAVELVCFALQRDSVTCIMLSDLFAWHNIVVQ